MMMWLKMMMMIMKTPTFHRLCFDTVITVNITEDNVPVRHTFHKVVSIDRVFYEMRFRSLRVLFKGVCQKSAIKQTCIFTNSQH